MHRQSLGSPLTKQQPLHSHSPNKHHQQPPYSSTASASSAASSSSLSGSETGDEEEEKKELKKLKLKVKVNNAPESYIHLIPLLTLLCFLILYLSSHNPSQTDLAQFSDFKYPSGENISKLKRVVEIKSGDILAIRSLKNLKRNELMKPRRLHRKIAHF